MFDRVKSEGFDVCKLKEALGMMGDIGEVADLLWDAYNAYQAGDSYKLGHSLGKLLTKGLIAAATAGAGAAAGAIKGIKPGKGGPSTQPGIPCPNSFAAGTLILMADGSLKPIEQVQTGEEVLAKDETSGKIEKKRITAKFEGRSPVLALTFSNGERLLVTADHPLYVEGQGFRAAQQCGIGTSI